MKPIVIIFILLLRTIPFLAQKENITGAWMERIEHCKTREIKRKTCNRIVDSLVAADNFTRAYALLQELHARYDELHTDSFTPDLHYASGDFYIATANYTKAIEHFFKSDALYEKQHRPKGRCSVLTNLGNCYYYLNNLDRALACYKQALSINEEIMKDEEISSNLYNNIGIIYSVRNNFVMGRNFFLKSLAVYLKKADSLSVGQTYNNLASIMLELDNVDSAFLYFNKARLLKEKFGSKNDIIDSYNNLASIYIKMEDDEHALAYLQKNLRQMDTSFYSPDLKATYTLLNKIYDKKKDLTRAYLYYKLSRMVGDTIDARNKSSELLQKEVYFQVNKAHLADSLATAEETKIRTLELEQKKKQNFILILAVIIAIGVSVVLYNRFRVTRQQKQIIDIQKRTVEQKQKEVLDSIHYAKRIQQSLLTSEKYIERILKNRKT